ncbi:hypothetical protein B0H14DRAFT_3511973 [Mycena olivaceomarginata]|nr:hypothetical protein B0H14DRAFT_3511973 [Mycena olivaceomarginata]
MNLSSVVEIVGTSQSILVEKVIERQCRAFQTSSSLFRCSTASSNSRRCSDLRLRVRRSPGPELGPPRENVVAPRDVVPPSLADGRRRAVDVNDVLDLRPRGAENNLSPFHVESDNSVGYGSTPASPHLVISSGCGCWCDLSSEGNIARPCNLAGDLTIDDALDTVDHHCGTNNWGMTANWLVCLSRTLQECVSDRKQALT